LPSHIKLNAGIEKNIFYNPKEIYQQIKFINYRTFEIQFFEEPC